ncbi:right-handed parallel beta-helix repeat-containing protein [Mucilaginibacter pedocola]|nr:right-handed parallel beta-helix repeat-containing protein [Mucilaginibacter pedocola]
MRGIALLMMVSSFTMCAKKIDVTTTPTTKPGEVAVVDTAKETTSTPSTPPTTPTTPTATYTIKPTDWQFDGAKVPAGAVIYIPAGTRSSLLIKNLKGNPEAPITIVNQGGQVHIDVASTASYAFKTTNCQFFKVLGNGVSSVKYGINLSGGNIGVTFDDLSTDFEVANIEVRNCAFAGIMAKTDPSCDAATQRGHFTMANVKVHDNYVHKTGGEGYYIGNSFYKDGVSLSCGRVMPHDVLNLKVYNNVADSTGCEGIQVGAAISGAEVYNNTVTNPGLSPFASGQNNGIQLGEGTGGKCYNNLIKNAPGNGIILLGLGDNLLYNNIIISAGGHGIFADSRYTPGPNFQFINNTIISPGQDGIKLNSETIPMNTAINNLIIITGSGTAINRMSRNVKLTSLNNYTGRDISAVKFVDFAGGDYRLQPGSPLLGAGALVLTYGITLDFYGKQRSGSTAVTIGATE